MSKAQVSRFFASAGFVILVVACFVVGIPHALFGEGGLFWLTLGFTNVALAFAIDHWPSKGAS
jgi:hypothetical protein